MADELQGSRFMKMGDRYRMHRAVFGILIGWMVCYGCSNAPEDLQIQEAGDAQDRGIPVRGYALIGSQCPYGTISPSQEARVELYNCPLNLAEVELDEPLQPLILQADCKKKTIDVRGGVARAYATTWEFMPDGSFDLTLNSGEAKLRADGSGNSDCTTPVAAELIGKVDCTDRDKAVIDLEVIWWLGKNVTESPRPNPSVRPSGSPTVLPTGSPRPNPSPSPSASPRVTPSPSPSHSGRRGIMNIRALSVSGSCNIPTESRGCYFYSSTQIRQCQ